MDIFELALEVKGAIRTIAKQGPKTAIGDQGVAEIPDAEEINALLVKGPNGSRFRVDGIRYTREA